MFVCMYMRMRGVGGVSLKEMSSTNPGLTLLRVGVWKNDVFVFRVQVYAHAHICGDFLQSGHFMYVFVFSSFLLYFASLSNMVAYYT